MNFHTYLPTVLKRARQLDHEQQVQHAKLGMVTEVGELADMVKRHVIYDKAIDHINGLEEIGDFCWYLSLYSHEQGVAMHELDKMVDGDAPMPLTDAVLMLAGLVGALCIDEAERGPLDREVLTIIMPLVAFIAGHFSGSMDLCLEVNDFKLALRFSEGQFSSRQALSRDPIAERALLEEKVRSHPDWKG